MGNVRRHWGKIRSSIRKLMGIWRETCREFPLRGFLRRFSIRFIYNWNCPRMSMKSYDYGEIYLISKSVHSSHFSMMPRPPHTNAILHKNTYLTGSWWQMHIYYFRLIISLISRPHLDNKNIEFLNIWFIL